MKGKGKGLIKQMRVPVPSWTEPVEVSPFSSSLSTLLLRRCGRAEIPSLLVYANRKHKPFISTDLPFTYVDLTHIWDSSLTRLHSGTMPYVVGLGSDTDLDLDLTTKENDIEEQSRASLQYSTEMLCFSGLAFTY